MDGQAFKGVPRVAAREAACGDAVRRQNRIVIIENGGDMQILGGVDTTDSAHRRDGCLGSLFLAR